MSTDPFIVLGIDKGASQSEILEAYKFQRKYYSDRLFNEGEEGAEAARNLEQLETAYQAAMEFCHANATVSGEGDSNFEDVKAAIRNKDIEKAQRELDAMTYRGGEWHYFQSIVFYEKSWLAESKKQLEIALELDPGNEKYKKALENIKKKVDGGKPFQGQNANTNNNANNGNFSQNQNTYTQRSYQQPRNGDAADGCCAACQALWCADCCCECMGGDCISCC